MQRTHCESGRQMQQRFPQHTQQIVETLWKPSPQLTSSRYAQYVLQLRLISHSVIEVNVRLFQLSLPVCLPASGPLRSSAPRSSMSGSISITNTASTYSTSCYTLTGATQIAAVTSPATITEIWWKRQRQWRYWRIKIVEWFPQAGWTFDRLANCRPQWIN